MPGTDLSSPHAGYRDGPSSGTRLNVAVGIPTVGRPGILRATLAHLACQTRAPDRLLVCATQPADVEGTTPIGPHIDVLYAMPGLPRQRNTILAAAARADVLVFFDDDFLPDPRYLAVVEHHLRCCPDTVIATGRVLADGIKGPGLSVADAKAILARSRGATHGVHATFSGYGCNMAVRLEPMRRQGVQFDERLPLYGWQEDVDLSRRLASFGKVVRLDAATGVHLGVKLGRGSGVRLGYSQVANPLYLALKRDGYPFGRAVVHILRNMANNITRAPWPEPYIDRRGRMLGNVLALRDLARGRMRPERVLDL